MATASTIESINDLELAITETRLQGLKVRKYQMTSSALVWWRLWAHRAGFLKGAGRLERSLSGLVSTLEHYDYAALEAKDAEEIYGMIAKQIADCREMLALLDEAGNLLASAMTAKAITRIADRLDTLEDILEAWQLSRDSRFRGMVEAAVEDLRGEESSAALSR